MQYGMVDKENLFELSRFQHVYGRPQAANVQIYFYFPVTLEFAHRFKNAYFI